MRQTLRDLDLADEIAQLRASTMQSVLSGRTVALLTGGRDKPYALGLASSLIKESIAFDFIGSDLVDGPELHDDLLVRFLKLRDQQANPSSIEKVLRIIRYYGRLISYAWHARPKLFHVLWNNKVEWFDRTVLMIYYRLLGKKIVLTVHNVNVGKRDGTDSPWKRLTLRAQYHLADHLFVHTEKMKQELASDFDVPEGRITVIPFGINNSVPSTELSVTEARRQIGLLPENKTVLFFGNIAPYKGLEYLVRAFERVDGAEYRLIIAGSPKCTNDYWLGVKANIDQSGARQRIIERIEYIADEETEVFFKAADVLVLPYTHVFQSGVLFLGYSFGLPAIVTDVGALSEEVVEANAGFVCLPRDSASMAAAIRQYFQSDLYHNLTTHRTRIKQYANERYSWTKVGIVTAAVYGKLLDLPAATLHHPASGYRGKLSRSHPL